MGIIGSQKRIKQGSEQLSGDGVTTVFALTQNVLVLGNTTSIQVFISGIAQPTSSFTVSERLLTFSSAPPLGNKNIVVVHDYTVVVAQVPDTITMIDTLAVLNTPTLIVPSTLTVPGATRLSNVTVANGTTFTINTLNYNSVLMASNYATFQAAVLAAAPNGNTILVSSNTVCSANTTVPANVRLQFVGPGKITLSTPFTLNILSPVDVGPRQIFSVRPSTNSAFSNVTWGSSSLTFSGPGARALPQWFGAKADGVTNDTTAFYQGLQSLTNGGVFYIPTGHYHLRRGNGGVLNRNILSSNVTIMGDGPGSYLDGRRDNGTWPDDVSSQYYSLLQGGNNSHVIIRDLGFGGYTIPIALHECSHSIVQRITCDGSAAHVGNNKFRDKAVYMLQCYDTQILDSYFYNYYFAVYMIAPDFRTGLTTTDTLRCELTQVEGCHFEHTYEAGKYFTLFPVGVYPVDANNTIITHNTFKNLYSSVDSANPTTGMGYGVWQGDGKNGSIQITDNTFLFEGRGLKRSAGIFVGISDGDILISGNHFMASGSYSQCYYAIGMELGTPPGSVFGGTWPSVGTHVSITDNLMVNDEVLNGYIENGQSNAGWAIRIENRGYIRTDLHIAKNHVMGGWRNFVALTIVDRPEGYGEFGNGIGKSTITVEDNFVRGSEGCPVFIVGSSYQAYTLQPIIKGNRFIGGNTGGILLNYTLGATIENNVILDGNLSGITEDNGLALPSQSIGACMVLGVTTGSTMGYRIVNNVLGNSLRNSPNSPQPIGQHSYGIWCQDPADTRIYKDIIRGNQFIGFENGANTITRFHNTAPTSAFLDISPGEIVYNSRRDLAPTVEGWLCVSSSFVPLTANLVYNSTSVAVADTTGWLAGDNVLLVRANTIWFRDSSEPAGVGNTSPSVHYFPPGTGQYWHATSIQSVVNATHIIISTALADTGTYYKPKAYIKRVRFVAI